MEKIMSLGVGEARQTLNENKGGPFGAVIVDKDNNVISVASNLVLELHDPSAHAEIMAIRKAGEILKTHDLSGCKIYATGYPCPMCLSAIMWANIKEVYYGCTKKDAANTGFRDDAIYDFLNGKNIDLINMKQIDREECIKIFDEYKENNGIIY